MIRRLRVRLAIALTALATFLSLVLAPAVHADETAPPKSVSGEPGAWIWFAPATSETTAWRPVNDASVPSWLEARGGGDCDVPPSDAGCTGQNLTRLLVAVLDAPYGATVTFPIVEYTRTRGEVTYDLTVTVGAGTTMLSPVTANAVAGAESWIPVRGAVSPTRGVAGWRAAGGPAWLDGASTNGQLEYGRYAQMMIRVPAGLQVGDQYTTQITEWERTSDGRDLGRLQYDLTLRIRPPLESQYATQQYSTTFDQPLVVPEARLTQQLPAPDELEVLSAFAAESRVAIHDRATVSWTPQLTDAGHTVPVTWQVGYQGVVGHFVARTAEVTVTFDEGPLPVAGTTTAQKRLRAGRTVRVPLGIGAQHSTPFLWSVSLQAAHRGGGLRDPDTIRAEVETLGEQAYAVVRTTKAVRPGGYYVVARLTDRYGKSAKHRVVNLDVRR